MDWEVDGIEELSLIWCVVFMVLWLHKKISLFFRDVSQVEAKFYDVKNFL